MTPNNETTTEPVGGDSLFGNFAEQWDRVMHADALLAESGQTPDDVVGQLMALEGLKARLAELGKLVEHVRQTYGLQQIERLGRAVWPYYAGTETTKKCRNVAATMKALEEACRGDVDVLNGCLSAGAWKPGECAKVLGEDFGRYFEVTETRELRESKAKGAAGVKLLKASSYGRD